MQHSGAEAEAVYRLEVFGEQHWQAVKVAAVQAVSDVEEAAQLAAPEHCFAVARTVVEVAARHCRSAVVEEAASKTEEFA